MVSEHARDVLEKVRLLWREEAVLDLFNALAEFRVLVYEVVRIVTEIERTGTVQIARPRRESGRPTLVS